MLIAIILVVVGFLLSLRARIVVLVPVSVVLIASFTLIWVALGQFNLFRVAILIGYIFALNTGYLIGASTIHYKREQ
ncbi:hypothetical protein [Bosea sp. PAMC 26642]|uniref:hypothetical protein n=1 Tax=Bosea sp. (strain PAMC 26642) TaxID=1792307 RepID=UPI000B07AC21|nr:hypothetical protein [Bosea sp. PAMC 26642]